MLAIPTIAVYNQSSVLGDTEVDKACQAIDKQVKNHVFNAWGLTADVVFKPNTIPVDSSWWRVVVLDNSDIAQALGYHDFTPAGMPEGKVFAKSDQAAGLNWTVTLSHEVLEMIVDPDIVRCAFDDNASRLWAYEVCDACEADSDGYIITVGDPVDILVSDFVFPAYFEPFNNIGPYDYQQKITRPFQVLPGGYMSILDVGNNLGWQSIFCHRVLASDPSQMVPGSRAHLRPVVGSRRERRRVKKSTWMKSTK